MKLAWDTFRGGYRAFDSGLEYVIYNHGHYYELVMAGFPGFRGTLFQCKERAEALRARRIPVCPHCKAVRLIARKITCKKCMRDACIKCIEDHPSFGYVCELCYEEISDTKR